MNIETMADIMSRCDKNKNPYCVLIKDKKLGMAVISLTDITEKIRIDLFFEDADFDEDQMYELLAMAYKIITVDKRGGCTILISTQT